MSVDASQSGLGGLDQPIGVALPVDDRELLRAKRGEHATVFRFEPPRLANECQKEAVAALKACQQFLEVGMQLWLERSHVEQVTAGWVPDMTGVVRAAVSLAALHAVDDPAY